MPLARKGGLRAIWFGIEDMTGGLVKKGQSAGKVEELFPEMRRRGIWPMPMLMHYEGQPFYTRGRLDGIANQVAHLYRSGAGSVQITFLTPAVGTKLYDEPFLRGAVPKRVHGMEVDDHFYDGNHVLACDPKTALKHQLQLLAAYVAFYNPINFLSKAIHFAGDKRMNANDASVQVLGIAGWLRSIWRMRKWIWKQWLGPIEPYAGPPRSPWPIHTVEQLLARTGAAASDALHALETVGAARRATA
jgi:hypothetical protein